MQAVGETGDGTGSNREFSCLGSARLTLNTDDVTPLNGLVQLIERAACVVACRAEQLHFG